MSIFTQTAFRYRLLRAFDNGRLQSAWKTLGWFFNRAAFCMPSQWGWGKRYPLIRRHLNLPSNQP